MNIKSVKLTNFRNHANYFLECNQNPTLILGNNGCGKTSVLEAIYILTQGKSFRASDRDIVKYGTDFYRAELEYISGEKVVAVYDGKKVFSTLDKKTTRLPKKSKSPTVLFLPSDLNLISHSPGRRRDYFDRIFSQFNEDYAISLSKYEKALKQRNELLKQEQLIPEQTFSWNLMLAKYGSNLSTQRQKFIQEFNSSITKTYQSISDNHDNIQIDYQTEAHNYNESDFLKQLEQNFQKDHYIGHTSFGTHRDDYIFIFNQAPADTSASRGETRSIILALKFIEATLMEQKLGQKPLVLLDDVFSELDSTRRKCLTQNFKNHQTIITSVEK